MFSLQARIKPSGGAAPELRELLKDWVGTRQAAGDRTNLLELMWGAEGVEFKTVTLHDSIAAAAETRNRMIGDHQFLTFAGKMTGLIREQPNWSLREIIVRPPAPASANYVIHVTMQAAVGKNGELRQIMTGWCEQSHKKGNMIALSEEVWGACGGTFAVRVPFQSLDEAEKSRIELNADTEYQQLARNLAGVMSGPSRWELLHVVSAGQ